MKNIKIGDIVSRKSYNSDISFRVTAIEQGHNEKIYILKGLSYRILADSEESDLILVNENNNVECECSDDNKTTQNKRGFKKSLLNVLQKK